MLYLTVLHLPSKEARFITASLSDPAITSKIMVDDFCGQNEIC